MFELKNQSLLFRSYPTPIGYPANKECAFGAHIFAKLDSRFRGNERSLGEAGIYQ